MPGHALASSFCAVSGAAAQVAEGRGGRWADGCNRIGVDVQVWMAVQELREEHRDGFPVAGSAKGQRIKQQREHIARLGWTSGMQI